MSKYEFESRRLEPTTPMREIPVFCAEQVEKPGSGVKLATNPTIEYIAAELRVAMPDWKNIFERMRYKPLTFSQAVGLAGELHVNNVINEIAANPDMTQTIDLQPLALEYPEGTHRLVKTPDGNVIASDIATNQNSAEYDFFLEAEGLALAGEVRITRKRESIRKFGGGLISLFQEETIAAKLKPLEPYYPSDEGQVNLGYAVVGMREAVLPEYHKGYYEGDVDDIPDSPEKAFLERGGVLVTLPFGLKEAKDRVEDFFSSQTSGHRNTSYITYKPLQQALKPI
jgi:hypothetical protein